MNQIDKDIKFLKKTCPNAIEVNIGSKIHRAYSLTFDTPHIILFYLKDKFYIKGISPSIDNNPHHIDVFVQAYDEQ